jgi:hypothetical protein
MLRRKIKIRLYIRFINLQALADKKYAITEIIKPIIATIKLPNRRR